LGSDFRLRLANPAFEKLWNLEGLSHQYPEPHASEVLMHAEHFFKNDADIDTVKDRLFATLNERIPRQSRLICADGRIIQFTYVPLPDGSHLLSFVDISDVTRFERALQERNQALEQAARLKSDFISNVSYELRAPLNTILGFTEMLTNQYFGVLNERQIDYCHNILDSSQRLMRLINDMIDMASIEAGQLTLAQHPIHLESFLNSTIGLVFHRANDQGLEIISENLTQIHYFVGDERRLKQALFNLLINSVKHTPSSGKICLEASLSTNRKHLLLKVQDTGVGIQQEHQNRIFKLFEYGPQPGFQKKSGGVGLGLPLVKSLIELHGGVVKIESKSNTGTTITCELPLVLPPPPLQAEVSI
jgi:signal transduction histidine kinase